MTENKLGERLKARRIEKGLTLAGLSEKSGVNTSYIGRIEHGSRFPSARVLRKLAEALGFEEPELLKMAGYLSSDETDERIRKFKDSMKGEIEQATSNLLDKVDTL